MRAKLRDYADMRARLDELEANDDLNLLILKHEGTFKDENEVVRILLDAFEQYIQNVQDLENTEYKMKELTAKMTGYIEAVTSDPEHADLGCLRWINIERESWDLETREVMIPGDF